jgi:hypothetical protein
MFPQNIYFILKGFQSSISSKIISLIWQGMCFGTISARLIIPMLETWEILNSIILNTLSTRVEARCWFIQQGIMLCIPNLSLTILAIGILPLLDSCSWLSVAPSSAGMLPVLLNTLFLTLRIALEEEHSRWGNVWLLMNCQKVAMTITEEMDAWCDNQLHTTCRANQLLECSCLQPIMTCHVLAGTHNHFSVCNFFLWNSFKDICVISSISSL